MQKPMSLLLVAVLGAIAGTVLRPGIPEILIVAGVLTGVFLCRKPFSTKRLGRPDLDQAP
ncbi:MAG TPA: hypothetical protein VE988_03395 [Gemmataceae bacterium]|nr:hypothetical protein [Gemmataceae bacterium]